MLIAGSEDADFGLSPPTFSEKSERKKSVKAVSFWQKIA